MYINNKLFRKIIYDSGNHHYYDHLCPCPSEVVTFVFSRNMGCFTRDIHDLLACSCSATIETPSNCCDYARVEKGRISRAKRPGVMTELLCYDLTNIPVQTWYRWWEHVQMSGATRRCVTSQRIEGDFGHAPFTATCRANILRTKILQV